jgi:hypothetical protein
MLTAYETTTPLEQTDSINLFLYTYLSDSSRSYEGYPKNNTHCASAPHSMDLRGSRFVR